MTAPEDSIPKAIELLIQKTSSLKCSDSILPLVPNAQTTKSACQRAVAIKIVADKIFTRKAVNDLISNAWNLFHSWNIASAGLHEQNIFHMTFEHDADKRRVMDLRPWSINGRHIIIRDSLPDTTTLETDFSHSCFWIQAHGIPPSFFTEANAILIGNQAGKFLESQFKAASHLIWSRFMRIRVDVTLAKPLFAGFYLERRNNSKVWIQLKYERLSDFCYKCG
ncbi:Zinc knuckle CX2CX4HX4C [Trema orientale]|uniref:Zinc knuckle CX2CX4HX4C n=1 Tax=Trema orientale TaxID=63057 RepID=A0A2P5A9Q8_TREOI|nr:Zinc knuckle CX2CX4HX4C [Trema orientale]